MTGNKKVPTEITGYKIVGRNCGRDEKGAFHCVCGMCRPLRKQSEDRSYSGNDSRNSRNDTDSGV